MPADPYTGPVDLDDWIEENAGNLPALYGVWQEPPARVEHSLSSSRNQEEREQATREQLLHYDPVLHCLVPAPEPVEPTTTSNADSCPDEHERDANSTKCCGNDVPSMSSWVCPKCNSYWHDGIPCDEEDSGRETDWSQIEPGGAYVWVEMRNDFKDGIFERVGYDETTLVVRVDGRMYAVDRSKVVHAGVRSEQEKDDVEPTPDPPAPRESDLQPIGEAAGQVAAGILRILEFEGTKPVRVVLHNGETVFEATPLAENLGHKNPWQAIATHCKGLQKLEVPTAGGTQLVNFITEPDIYRLTAGSKTQGAQKFQDWLFEEVLPAIRKHGVYLTPQTQEAFLNDPDAIITVAMNLKRELEARLQAEHQATLERDQRLLAETKVEEMRPDAEWAADSKRHEPRDHCATKKAEGRSRLALLGNGKHSHPPHG